MSGPGATDGRDELIRRVEWVVEDRETGAEVLRGWLSEDGCRCYVARDPERFRLIRIDVRELRTEVDP